jgi:S-formylglutathione hydrolase FrmB
MLDGSGSMAGMVRRRVRRRLSGAFVCAALAYGAVSFAGTAAAAPLDPAGSGPADWAAPWLDRLPWFEHRAGPGDATVDDVEEVTDRWLKVFVNSPAMGRVVQVQVLLPADRDTPRPTLYMLDGRAASDQGNSWIDRGGALDFFADKNVNVVLTVGGQAGYYTDWQQPDPVLGNNKWETFLTRELPPLIDAEFGGNGRNAVEGVSMGAEAATMLVMRNPELYRAVAAHSGCYAMGSEFGQAQARAVVGTYGGDPNNMFGDQHDPDLLAHDVLVNADALRGKAIYLSAGSGMPGEFDALVDVDSVDAMVFGGPLEAGSHLCTMVLADRLARMQIPATVDLRPAGTHSWPYWAGDLARAWPTLAQGLGLG